jgi:hypothetical protein
MDPICGQEVIAYYSMDPICKQKVHSVQQVSRWLAGQLINRLADSQVADYPMFRDQLSKGGFCFFACFREVARVIETEREIDIQDRAEIKCMYMFLKATIMDILRVVNI